MQCREPVQCGSVPEPPRFSGLVAEERPEAGYTEFSSAKYSCSDSSHVLYMGSEMLSVSEFEVQCIPPGKMTNKAKIFACNAYYLSYWLYLSCVLIN